MGDHHKHSIVLSILSHCTSMYHILDVVQKGAELMSDRHKHCLVLSVLFYCTGVYHILHVVHNGTTAIVTNTALYCLVFSHCNSIHCKGLIITTEICCIFLFVMWSAHLT